MKTEDDWKRIAGSIIDTVHLTNEDYVNEKLVEQLKRYFARQEEALRIAERCLTELYPSTCQPEHEAEYYAVNKVINAAREALSK